MAGKPASKSPSSAGDGGGKAQKKGKSPLGIKGKLKKGAKSAPPPHSMPSTRVARPRGAPTPGGWQSFAVGDDFLAGLDEGGFMGLETMTAPQMTSSAGGMSITPTAPVPKPTPATASPPADAELGVQTGGAGAAQDMEATGGRAAKQPRQRGTVAPAPTLAVGLSQLGTAVVATAATGSGGQEGAAEKAAGPPLSRFEKHEIRKRERAVQRAAVAAAAEAGGVAAVGDASANGGDVDDAFGGVAALREKVMHWRSVRA